jgi:hypothetical protein
VCVRRSEEGVVVVPLRDHFTATRAHCTGILEKGSWPKDKSGRRVADKGKLPLNAPEVKEILADPTHRNKVFVKPLFAVACGRKSENPHGLTKADCERLKVNMGYFIKMCRRELFPEFLRRSQAVIQHHFNDHSICGKWCNFSTELEPEKRMEITTETATKFRDKMKQPGLCKVVKRLTTHLLSPEMLRESHHPHDSQKTKQ